MASRLSASNLAGGVVGKNPHAALSTQSESAIAALKKTIFNLDTCGVRSRVPGIIPVLESLDSQIDDVAFAPPLSELLE